MSEEKALTFDELVGELREFGSRVVAFDVRDQAKNPIASGEGEFRGLEMEGPGEWFFQLGGAPDREGEGTTFVSASWTVIYIDAQRVLEAHDTATGIGPAVHLRVRLKGGIEVTLWPAMPPEQQWTEMHHDTR